MMLSLLAASTMNLLEMLAVVETGARATNKLILEVKYSGLSEAPRNIYVVPSECPTYEMVSYPVVSTMKSIRVGKSFKPMSSW